MTQTNKWSIPACILMMLAITAATFGQTSITLDFAANPVLPSASGSGFTYVTGGNPSQGTVGAPEDHVFTVSNGLLHMNTVDSTLVGSHMGYAWYQNTDIFDPTKDLLIEFEMRLFMDSPRDTRDFGMFAIGRITRSLALTSKAIRYTPTHRIDRSRQIQTSLCL